MIKLFSFNPKTKVEIPIWIDQDPSHKVVWLSPIEVPGEITDKLGQPMAKEGTLINLGAGGAAIVITPPEETIKLLREQDG